MYIFNYFIIYLIYLWLKFLEKNGIIYKLCFIYLESCIEKLFIIVFNIWLKI